MPHTPSQWLEVFLFFQKLTLFIYFAFFSIFHPTVIRTDAYHGDEWASNILAHHCRVSVLLLDGTKSPQQETKDCTIPFLLMPLVDQVYRNIIILRKTETEGCGHYDLIVSKNGKRAVFDVEDISPEIKMLWRLP